MAIMIVMVTSFAFALGFLPGQQTHVTLSPDREAEHFKWSKEEVVPAAVERGIKIDADGVLVRIPLTSQEIADLGQHRPITIEVELTERVRDAWKVANLYGFNGITRNFAAKKNETFPSPKETTSGDGTVMQFVWQMPADSADFTLFVKMFSFGKGMMPKELLGNLKEDPSKVMTVTVYGRR